jgi:hypothetical protein
VTGAPSPGDPCPQCGERMLPSTDIQRRRRWSRDHIFPREMGGAFLMDPHPDGPTRNWRVMCQGCNEQLAVCGHCVAALACARTVAADLNRSAESIARRWMMLYVARTIPRPGPDGAKALRAQRSVTQEMRRSMPHQMPVVRPVIAPVIPHDFIFPAVTAAERVWNLATLARKSG